MLTSAAAQNALQASDYAARPSWLCDRGLTAKVVCTETTRFDSYRTRYLSYRPHGYAPEREDGLFHDSFDSGGYSRSLVIYEAGRAIATIRLCSSGPEKSVGLQDTIPCAETFGPELLKLQEALIAEGRSPRIAEVNRLAKVPEMQSDNLITVGLFQMLKYLALASEAELVLVAIRFPHIKFYRRLGFEIIEAPRFVSRYNTSLALMACQRKDFGRIEHQVDFLFRRKRSLHWADMDDLGTRFLNGEEVPVFPVHKSMAMDCDERNAVPRALIN